MTESNYDRPIMYVTRMDAVLNRWFTTYEDARASLESEGGYLLPYKHQFFVTLSEGIRELGLDSEDATGRESDSTGCNQRILRRGNASSKNVSWRFEAVAATHLENPNSLTGDR